MPDFVDTTIKQIDDRLRALKEELAHLEAARAALTDTARRPSPTASNHAAAPNRTRSTARRSRRSSTRPTPRGGSTRATHALELVRKQPGITIPEIAHAMKIQPNYLYRVLPQLASDGEVKREGQGWRPATETRSKAPSPPRSRGTDARPAAPARPTRRRRSARTARTNGRTSRGATTASVLAALVGGEAMTAGQVATKAGLPRPTISTTLSKLAKGGQVQKAQRGYRLSSAA